MRRKIGMLPFLALTLIVIAYFISWIVDESSAGQAAEPARKERPAAEEKLSPEARMQQLDAREAALAAREQQVTKQSADMVSRAADLENSRKKIAATLEEQKNLQNERARKTLKIYRSLRPEESAKLLDRLDEATATGILNAMDQKTVAQLIPYLNQARVLKWTKETLAGAGNK